jgi:CAAX prenyl protease-like protein
MFDLPLFIVMCVIVVAANAVAVPKLIAYSNFFNGGHAPKIAQLSALTKALLLSLLACAGGAFAAPRTGLSAPFIESILHFDNPHAALWSQLWPALINSFYVLLGLMLLQLAFVRHHISAARYYSVPLSTKILLEGVVEEFIYRWGLMSVIARILQVEFLDDPNTAMLLAILLAAVGSSLSHISDLSRLNFDRISMALLAVMLINFWAALCYGWLFWKYGLTAAILCHMTVVCASVATYKMRCFLTLQEPG